MKPKVIAEGVKWVGVVDWNRRMFDSLIPLPDGTSYNAYLVQGTEKTNYQIGRASCRERV